MTYESYKAYLSVTSSNPSEEYKDFFKHLVEEDFDDSATIMTVNHNGADVKVRVVRVFTKEALNRPINNLKKIIFNNFDYEVSVGDIFYFDDKQWLCIDTGKTLYSRSCTVAKCHDTLKFYKSEISTNIVEIPYFVLDNIALTRMGYDDSRYMTLPYSRMLIMIANNEINREVSRDDVYKLKGYDNYEVVDINRIRFDGLMVLEMEISQSEQQIPTPPSPTPETGLKIQGSNEIKFGQTANYQAIKYVDDEIITNAKFVFSIHNVSADMYELIVVDDRNCKIKCNGYPGNLTLRARDLGSFDDEFVDKFIVLRGLL